jgi:hypothetical protein
MSDMRPSEMARRLAGELLENHSEADAKQKFLEAVGRPPYAGVIGASEALTVFAGAMPQPEAPPVKTFHFPAVADPTGLNRYQIVRALVEFGVRPQSLADACLRLIESGAMDKDQAIAWAREEHRVAVLSGSSLREPWIAAASKAIAEARRES